MSFNRWTAEQSGSPTQRNTMQQEIRMNGGYVWWPGWISREWCWAQRANPKVTHCLTSSVEHSQNGRIIEMENRLMVVRSERDSTWKGTRPSSKRQYRGPSWWWGCSELHCLSVSKQFVMLYYSFTNITIGGNWIKVRSTALYYLSQLHTNR